MSNAEVVYDHYVKHFGVPREQTVFEHSDVSGAIQVLEFSSTFEGCTSFASLGFGRYSTRTGSRFQEAVLTVEGDARGVPSLLGGALVAVIYAESRLEPGATVGSLETVAQEFVRATGKSALLFCRPFVFPEPFAYPSDQSEILMAVPISTEEYRFAQANGAAALQEVFSDRDVDAFSAIRKSAI